jgi:hypothetical protein
MKLLHFVCKAVDLTKRKNLKVAFMSTTIRCRC